MESPTGDKESKSAATAFKRLKLLDLRTEEARKAEIPLGPSSLLHGVLDNGLTYYVRQNPKPKQRAALALGVRIGSVVEAEEERGVAHIVEHLAFSATRRYDNHQIVRFLESIGAEFGACQNAYTSADETVFELFVPVDRPELLSESLSVLAEFSSSVRAAQEDLDKERGAVMEELRGRRNASGRMQEAHWSVLMKGSRYAERQPIGLEKVIKGVPAEVVKAFYKRWYRPENMAVVAVGDFESAEGVVEQIKEQFGSAWADGGPAGERVPVPEFPFLPHKEPRFSVFAEKEAAESAVMVSCKMPQERMASVADYREFMGEEMFHMALNQRFFKLSRQPDPPFYSATSGGENLVRPARAFLASAACKDRGTLAALEAILTEIARVRLHGFSDREVALVRSLYMATMESAYLERDQIQSASLRDEYMQHFLRADPVPGIEYEAQLAKTLLPEISAGEVAAYARNYGTERSCVVKTVEPRARATVDDVRAVIGRVEALEAGGGIGPWTEDDIPENIVAVPPVPGTVEASKEYEEMGATELLLSNGMRVCYKQTDFLDDQVLISGYAYGGLSEAPEGDHHSYAMAQVLAGEVGIYGHPPSVLSDMLAGKRADVAARLSAYTRTFSADCSPADLETGLQLVYQLFATRVEPRDAELAVVMQMALEAVRAKERDPFTAYAERVREVNYGQSYYFKPVTAKELKKVDPKKACEYFDRCFKDPSSFTVAIVGNLEPEKALPLILQYLGGIPRPAASVQQFQRDELTPLPFKFPEGALREEVHRTMVEEQGSTQITFPIELGGPNVMEEIHWTFLMCKLLETKIMQVLRFKHSQVYSVSVTTFLGGSRPSRSGDLRGDIAISFSHDPGSTWKLVDLVMEEVQRLQDEGPAEDDCATVVELEKRAYETGLQENSFWLDRLLRAYQSRAFSGDLLASFKVQEEKRDAVMAAATAASMREALLRILPHPCTARYTAISLMPQAPLWRRLLSLPPKQRPGLTDESKVRPPPGALPACAPPRRQVAPARASLCAGRSRLVGRRGSSLGCHGLFCSRRTSARRRVRRQRSQRQLMLGFCVAAFASAGKGNAGKACNGGQA